MYFFLFFFAIYKNGTWQLTIIKYTKKSSNKKHVKNIKIFTEKKKTQEIYKKPEEEEKTLQYHRERNKNLSEKQKEKVVE